MIGKLLNYVYKTRRGAPPPPRQRVIMNYGPDDVKNDEKIILMARLARDPLSARAELDENGFAEVYNVPLNFMPNPVVRFWGWLRRLEGSLPSDPYQIGRIKQREKQRRRRENKRQYNQRRRK